MNRPKVFRTKRTCQNIRPYTGPLMIIRVQPCPAKAKRHHLNFAELAIHKIAKRSSSKNGAKMAAKTQLHKRPLRLQQPQRLPEATSIFQDLTETFITPMHIPMSAFGITLHYIMDTINTRWRLQVCPFFQHYIE